jgi:hypothetical protein
MLCNVAPGRFLALAGNELQGWRYRFWTTPIDVPTVDLWHPGEASFDAVRAWAAAAGCEGLAWRLEGGRRSWETYVGAGPGRGGTAPDAESLVLDLRPAISALGEGPYALGGRGREGWAR